MLARSNAISIEELADCMTVTHFMSDRIFYFNEQYCIMLIQKSKRDYINEIAYMFCAFESGSSVFSACEQAVLLIQLLVNFIAWYLHCRNTIIVASRFLERKTSQSVTSFDLINIVLFHSMKENLYNAIEFDDTLHIFTQPSTQLLLKNNFLWSVCSAASYKII